MDQSELERFWGIPDDNAPLDTAALFRQMRADLSTGRTPITFAEVLQQAHAADLFDARLLADGADAMWLAIPLGAVWAQQQYPGRRKEVYTDFGRFLAELIGDAALGPPTPESRRALAAMQHLQFLAGTRLGAGDMLRALRTVAQAYFG